MKKIILKTLLGITTGAMGIYLMHMFVGGLNNEANFLIFILSILLIIVALYFLLQAGKSDDMVINKLKGFNIFKTKKNDEGFKKVLEKNNELSKMWGNTVEKRDKLKMLEISAAAESETTKE